MKNVNVVLNVQRLIKENQNWKEIIQNKPYCITLKENANYILLKYSQIDSDFKNDIVRECRGVIFRKSDMKPVCIPFYKFGNYGENYADDIDWNTAQVQEKIDGSLIKVWFDKEWHISTNGNIDAFESGLSNNVKYKNYGELFLSCITWERISQLNPHYTYMFELVSPYNHIVLKYDKTEIYHIGTRNNDTLQEIDVDIGIQKPQRFPLYTLDDCITSASMFDKHEGYVVVDKYYHRIKVKNPTYVRMHHMINNHTVTIKRLIEIINENEISEFVSYFPNYAVDIYNIQEKIDYIKSEIDDKIKMLKNMEINNKKELAFTIKDSKIKDALFLWYDGKINNGDEYWKRLTVNRKESLVQLVK